MIGQSLIYSIVLKKTQQLPHTTYYQTHLRINNSIYALIFKEQTEQEVIKDVYVGQKRVLSRLMLTKNSYSTATYPWIDINRAEYIYGEETPVLQIKICRNKPTVHSKIDIIPLPLPISERHKILHLYMDIFT